MPASVKNLSKYAFKKNMMLSCGRQTAWHSLFSIAEQQQIHKLPPTALQTEVDKKSWILPAFTFYRIKDKQEGEGGV